MKPNIYTAFFILFFFRPGGVFTVYTNKYKTATVKPRRRKEPPIVCVYPPFILAYAMAIKLKHRNIFTTYFITFTCMEWISLFEITNPYDVVYKWFTVLKNVYYADVVSYVIMPNHLHVILHFHNEGFNLNTNIANGKRFIAYEIINRLEEKGNTAVLHHLESLVTEREIKKGQVA